MTGKRTSFSFWHTVNKEAKKGKKDLKSSESDGYLTMKRNNK